MWGGPYPRVRGSRGIPERIERLGRALKYPSQTAFAKIHLGISPNRLNNVMRGMPLSISLNTLICRKCEGVAPEWLWEGEPGRLSPLMLRLLGELPRGAGGGSNSEPLRYRPE